MARVLWVLAIIAGCHTSDSFDCTVSTQCRGESSVGVCEPTGFCSFTDGSCPSGRRYDPSAGVDPTGTSLSGQCVVALDTDHDGVADVDDNCPTTFNPMQENEDGDPYGDACDPCPPFKETMPPYDSDNDGVSDLCDPHNDPIKPDRIVLFEGFHHGLPAGWTKTGTWTEIPDAMHFEGTSKLTVPLPASFGITYVYAGIDLTALGAADGGAGLTVGTMHCGVEEQAAMTSPEVVLHDDVQGIIGQASYPFGTKAYLVVAEWDPPPTNTWGCLVDDVATTSKGMTNGTAAIPSASTIGIANKNTSGDVGFVMVVAQ